ncbi:MAG: DUF4332 domain-containing protein [Planctomycetaceae bacterium]
MIAAASGYLARLTGRRYVSLETTNNGNELTAVNDSGLNVPVQSLSRGTQDQAALALRLALVQEYARRGFSLPLVLDDVLADTDRGRLDAAIDVLSEVGQVHQIIYMTCQETVAYAFEDRGVMVRDFPGTRRSPRSIDATEVRHLPFSAAIPVPPLPDADDSAVELTDEIAELDTESLDFQLDPPPASVHGGEPYWLRPDTAVGSVPSVGEQFARRLATAEIATVGDLIELDLGDDNPRLRGLQISPAQLRIWQSEARLLCCVPRITGRDAQLLVGVGVFSPAELAECDTDALVRKIDRLRGDGRSGWVSNGFVWPDRKLVSRWINDGRNARSFNEACESTGWTRRASAVGGDHSSLGTSASRSRLRRRSRLESGGSRNYRVDQPSSHRMTTRSSRSRRGLRTGSRIGQRAEREPYTRTTDADLQDAVEFRPQPLMTRTGRESDEVSRDGQLRFYLELSSAIVDAPSIGPTTARRLERVGVLTVQDLLSRDPQQLADRLQNRRINAEMIRDWQRQSRLMCATPELRGHDAQVLVACGLTEPERLARMSPQELFAIVGPFVATKEGQRLLRSSKTPDLAEVTDWIAWSQNARSVKAA